MARSALAVVNPVSKSGIVGVGWVRVSDAQQREKFGPAMQRAAIVAEAKAKGAVIIEWLESEDVRGCDVMEAPQTKRMLALMQARKINAVFAYALDRIARPSNFEAYQIYAACCKCGVNIYIPGKMYDLQNDPMAVFETTVMGGVAGLERNKIRQRCNDGRAQARLLARPVGGVMALGVTYAKKKGVWSYTDDGNPAKVRAAFDAVLSGNTNYWEIGRRYLDGRVGFTVKSILRNPLYKGWLEYRTKRVPNGVDEEGHYKSKVVQRDPEDVERHVVIDRPLVTPEEWQRVQDIMDTKRDTRRRAMKGGHTTYQGFLFCDVCGRLMTPEGHGGPSRAKGARAFHYYNCTGRKRGRGLCDAPRVRADVLDARIDALLAGEVTSPAFARRIVMGLEARSKDEREQDRVKKLERERKNLAAQRAAILKQHQMGVITDDELAVTASGIATELAKVDHELALAQPTANLPRLGVQEIAALFKPFAKWACRTREQKRKLLTVYIPRLRVRGGAVVSLYRILDAREAAVSPAAWEQATSAASPCSDKSNTL